MLRSWMPLAIIAGSLLVGAAGGASADRCDRNHNNGYWSYRNDRDGWYDRDDRGQWRDRDDRGHWRDRDDRNWRRHEELEERRAFERRREEARERDRYWRDRDHRDRSGNRGRDLFDY